MCVPRTHLICAALGFIYCGLVRHTACCPQPILGMMWLLAHTRSRVVCVALNMRNLQVRHRLGARSVTGCRRWGLRLMGMWRVGVRKEMSADVQSPAPAHQTNARRPSVSTFPASLTQLYKHGHEGSTTYVYHFVSTHPQCAPKLRIHSRCQAAR